MLVFPSFAFACFVGKQLLVLTVVAATVAVSDLQDLDSGLKFFDELLIAVALLQDGFDALASVEQLTAAFWAPDYLECCRAERRGLDAVDEVNELLERFPSDEGVVSLVLAVGIGLLFVRGTGDFLFVIPEPDPALAQEVLASNFIPALFVKRYGQVPLVQSVHPSVTGFAVEAKRDVQDPEMVRP